MYTQCTTLQPHLVHGHWVHAATLLPKWYRSRLNRVRNAQRDTDTETNQCQNMRGIFQRQIIIKICLVLIQYVNVAVFRTLYACRHARLFLFMLFDRPSLISYYFVSCCNYVSASKIKDVWLWPRLLSIVFDGSPAKLKRQLLSSILQNFWVVMLAVREGDMDKMNAF